MATIDFWFSIGSTYSYLTVSRIDALADTRGHQVVWRPFNVRQVFQALGYTPFADKPNKLAYMWRDLERRAQKLGVEWSRIPPYPLPELERANRLAVLGAREGWAPAYVRAAYERWFLHGERPGEAANMSAALSAAGVDAEAIMARADAADLVQALDEATQHADAAGVFGSPSFVVDGELFWGDDRLEDAFDWADANGS